MSNETEQPEFIICRECEGETFLMTAQGQNYVLYCAECDREVIRIPQQAEAEKCTCPEGQHESGNKDCSCQCHTKEAEE